jgi:uncharacterized protein (DUF2147 family)
VALTLNRERRPQTSDQMKLSTFALAGFAVALALPAQASDILGNWQRSDGKARILMAPCGGAVCGQITWLAGANAPAKVGQRVFYDLSEASGGWEGSAFNPQDGRTYTGKVTVAGGRMTTKGCVFGGLICKSVSWTRQ